MAENPFKVGDVVECIEGRSGGLICGQLVSGRTYSVERIHGEHIAVKDVAGLCDCSRFRLVSHPSEEWSNGDDVDLSEKTSFRAAKYIGHEVIPGCEDKHLVRLFDDHGKPLNVLQVLASEMRRPKPARTLEQLLERLGEDWSKTEDIEFTHLPGNQLEVHRVTPRDDGGDDEDVITIVRKSRQACIDAAWELLVKEDGDEADSAE